MRYRPINPQLFVNNRANLARLLLPNSLAVVNANDVLPTNADGTLLLRTNSDLFYLTGVEQEESILLLYPDAHEEKMREILFLRETNEHLAIWEGHKLTKEEARKVSGIERIEWLSEFRPLFHRLMCECDHVYLNSNEHKRAHIEVETREARFVEDTLARYPLHDYQRLARLMHCLRIVKSNIELDLIREACAITKAGFLRVCRFVKPGVTETQIEAEFAHEFTRRSGGFAYSPIIASGRNSNVLHYLANDQTCRKGDVLLLDVAASYANYNADLTRTIPVSGRFSRRQRQVYEAVLRVFRAASQAATPGKLPRDWQKEAEAFMER
jgi:Xaa-Pro aminopeptidase